MTLAAMRATALRNAIAARPVRHLIGLAFLASAGWGVFVATRRGVRFVDGFPGIGTIADAVLLRSVEGLVAILMLGVAFSVLTTAVTTLYASDDLPLLLSLPVPPERVFALKTLEVFATSALVPALLTVPVLLGLGLERGAPPTYYAAAALAVATLFALPVAAGALSALLLVRIAPAGRVREVATAANVLVAAALVVGLRALRPERVAALGPEEFERLLGSFARLEWAAGPPAWAAQGVWAALEGRLSPALVALVAVAVVSLAGVARLAAWAYRAGWIRSLAGTGGRRDPAWRPPAAWERPLARLGPTGAVWIKDLRTVARDPAQWSQLLVLAALAGVYLVSTGSIAVDAPRFRDALGTMNLAFLAFLLIGIGVRVAFPAVSLEGEGWWLVRTGPLRTRGLVMAKLLQVAPLMIVIGVAIGGGAAWLLDLSPALAVASPLAGASAGLVASALGVGLGAAWPRFDATDPAEVPLSAGGLVYMGAGTAYALALTVVLAWPAWRVISAPGAPVWSTPAGRLSVGLALALTALATVAPLALGVRRLDRYEPGD